MQGEARKGTENPVFEQVIFQGFRLQIGASTRGSAHGTASSRPVTPAKAQAEVFFLGLPFGQPPFLAFRRAAAALAGLVARPPSDASTALMSAPHFGHFSVLIPVSIADGQTAVTFAIEGYRCARPWPPIPACASRARRSAMPTASVSSFIS